MKTAKCCLLAVVALAISPVCLAEQTKLTVTAKNSLQIARPSETIELAWAELKKSLPTLHPQRVQVKDKASGVQLRWQVIDTDGDGSPDQLIFQGDFQPGETKTFLIEASPDWTPTQKTSVHCGYYDLHDVAREGKVVDEDDFAWENDRIAFRIYGPTTAKLFASSGVDVWVKRVPYPILDKWHDSIKDFHKDYGEGGDFYTVGGSRGCGGIAVRKDGKLYVSGDFVAHKVLANGPIRTMFEVTYAPWDAGGLKVSETKRISLDAGQNLSRHDITFQCEGVEKVPYAIGLAKIKDAKFSSGKESDWMGLWGPLNNDPKLNGELGIGVVVSQPQPVELLSTDEPWTYAAMPGHHLAVAEATVGKPATHYAGAGWCKGRGFRTADDWFHYLDQFAQRLRSPLEISVSGTP
jgi:pectinesterase